MPSCVLAAAYGATLALAAMTIITLKWKISAHMICFGGITGSVLAICSVINIINVPFITTLFFIAILLCWSRTYMKAHTPEQLGAGFLLGVLSTYCPILFI